LASQSDVIAAVQAGDLYKLKKMLEDAPSLGSARDASGVSALMHALYRRRADMAELLVTASPDLDIFEAAALGNAAKLSEILDRDRDAAKRWSGDGFTSLHFAAFFGRPEVAKDLIRCGADVAAVAKNPMKVMPLHSATAAHSGEIVRLLVENGAPPNVCQEGGWVPLHEAAQTGDKEMVKALLEYGADPRVKSDSGKTPAEMAQAKGHQEIVQLLSR
jgi:ankyrin repeat protein